MPLTLRFFFHLRKLWNCQQQNMLPQDLWNKPDTYKNISAFIAVSFSLFPSTFFLKVFVLWKCQLYSNEAQALFAHKGAGAFHCFMVYYEAQCESLGGTIWCLPLGVVTAIMFALDWQRKYRVQDPIWIWILWRKSLP